MRSLLSADLLLLIMMMQKRRKKEEEDRAIRHVITYPRGCPILECARDAASAAYNAHQSSSS